MTNIQSITQKAREMKELQRLAEDLQSEIVALQDDIKATMTAQGVDEMTAGEYKIRWSTVVNKRFDTTAFKTRYQDLYNQYIKESITKRFSVV